MKKLLSAVLVLVMVFAIIPLGVVTASAETLSGTTGDCTWTLVDGVLTISGNGAMGDYYEGDYAYMGSDGDGGWSSLPVPWNTTKVKKVIISNGVTEIGELAFYNCDKLETVVIADSVVKIKYGAFYGCDVLTSITLGSGIKYIAQEAFYVDIGYEPISQKNFYYRGSETMKNKIQIDYLAYYDNAKWYYILETGLIKASDGYWYYHVDGVRSYETTLIKYKGVWFYIVNGKWDNKAHTLVKYKGKGFYIKNGKWTKETTLVKYGKGYSYVENGKWKNTTTLCKYKGKTFYIENGIWKKTTLLFAYKDEIYYIKNGKVQSDFSGNINLKLKIENGKVV